MCKQNPLKHLRTLTGDARKQAARAHLTTEHGVTFGHGPHLLTWAQRDALSTLAKAVCWRKSISSSLSLGSAFYVYLSRGVA